MDTPFSLEDIDKAHQGVTRTTVRTYLKNLSDLGVVSYTSHISDGHSDYFDANGNCLSSAAIHETYDVAAKADRDAARRALDAHARGETNYFAFTRQLAEAGVRAWIMDPVAMTCTFCSTTGEVLIVDDV